MNEIEIAIWKRRRSRLHLEDMLNQQDHAGDFARIEVLIGLCYEESEWRGDR